MVQPAHDTGKSTPGMRKQDLKRRKSVEYAAENQMRRGHARVVRVSQQIAQVEFTSPVLADSLYRMQEHRKTESFARRIDRQERSVVEFFSFDRGRQVDS